MIATTLLFLGGASRGGRVGGRSRCGPSYQALYEGDARFEHCYALEENGAVDDDPEERLLARLDPALHLRPDPRPGGVRDRPLQGDDPGPAGPDRRGHDGGRARGGAPSSIAAPAPTSAFAPPPKTLDESTGVEIESNEVTAGYTDAGSAVVTEESAPPPPAAACTNRCEDKWSRCRDCDGGAKCAACTATYKACMRGCFAK